MTQMSMNKAIHGAFRRDLDRFVSALEHFPAGNRTRAAQLGTAWANFDTQLTRHHEGEHDVAWPALQAVGVSGEVIAAMDAEHDTMAAALTKARTAMNALTRTADAADAQTALAAMRALREVTVTHLEHEEDEIEPVYLAKADSPELKAMGRAFAKVSPSVGGQFFAWMLDGASPDEKAAVTRNVPGPVLSLVSTFWGRGYRKNIAPVWHS